MKYLIALLMVLSLSIPAHAIAGITNYNYVTHASLWAWGSKEMKEHGYTDRQTRIVMFSLAVAKECYDSTQKRNYFDVGAMVSSIIGTELAIRF